MTPHPVQQWLHANWFYAGLIAALFLLALTPVLWIAWPTALVALYLQLPAYMVHQVEEHRHDRFRSFFNQQLAQGRDLLTPDAVLVINVGGVWLVDLAAIYLAVYVHIGLGLIAVFLALVNVAVHGIAAVVLRAYNPGLVTALLVLLPAGLAGWWALARTGGCSARDYAAGLGFAIAIHAAILIYARLRLRSLRAG